MDNNINKKEKLTKPYLLTLEEIEVNKAKEKIKPYGGKLATLVNNLIKKFNKD